MKKILLLSLAAFFLTSIGAFAQLGAIESTTVDSKDKYYQAFQWSLDIPQDVVEDKLDDYMKNTYEAKLKGGGFLSSSDDQVVEGIKAAGYEMPVNVHVRLYTIGETEKTTQMVWWATDAEKTDKTQESLKQEMTAFVDSFAPAYFTAQKDEVLEEISDIDKDLTGVEKDVAKQQKAIDKLQSKLDKLEEQRADIDAKRTEKANEKKELQNEQEKQRKKKETLMRRLDNIKRHL